MLQQPLTHCIFWITRLYFYRPGCVRSDLPCNLGTRPVFMMKFLYSTCGLTHHGFLLVLVSWLKFFQVAFMASGVSVWFEDLPCEWCCLGAKTWSTSNFLVRDYKWCSLCFLSYFDWWYFLQYYEKDGVCYEKDGLLFFYCFLPLFYCSQIN